MIGNYGVKTGPYEWGSAVWMAQCFPADDSFMFNASQAGAFPQRAAGTVPGSLPPRARNQQSLRLPGRVELFSFSSFRFVFLKLHSTSLQPGTQTEATGPPRATLGQWWGEKAREEGPGGTAGISCVPSGHSPPGGQGAGSEPQLCPRQWHISGSEPRCPPGPPRLTNCSVRVTPASLSPSTKVISE